HAALQWRYFRKHEGRCKAAAGIVSSLRRPLGAAGAAPSRSVGPANGQRNQLAVVAVSIEPVALHHRAHTHAGTVDAGPRDETAVHLAEQVQVTFEVTYRHIAGKHCRTGQLTARKRIVAPQRGGRTL